MIDIDDEYLRQVFIFMLFHEKVLTWSSLHRIQFSCKD